MAQMTIDPNNAAGTQANASLQNLVTAVGELSQALSKVLAVVQTTSAGGTNSTWTGYLNVTLPNGTAAKVPYV